MPKITGRVERETMDVLDWPSVIAAQPREAQVNMALNNTQLAILQLAREIDALEARQ